MTKLEALEEEIGKLSASELAEFREWFAGWDVDEWDRQIERELHQANSTSCSRSRSRTISQATDARFKPRLRAYELPAAIFFCATTRIE
jgi:hypothetical protein